MCSWNVVVLDVKIFNLVSITNETKHIESYKTCKCKCRLNACVYKQGECKGKELNDKGTCDKGFIWNLINFQWECHKSCDVGEVFEYENCNCKTKLVDKWVEECNEEIDGNKMVYNATLNDYGEICYSCTIYIVLFAFFF